MMKEQQIEILTKLWIARNPCHDYDQCGKDRFWQTALLVIKEFNEATQPTLPVLSMDEIKDEADKLYPYVDVMPRDTGYHENDVAEKQQDAFVKGAEFASQFQKPLNEGWVKVEDRLPELDDLIEANDIIRSFYSVIERMGKDTNWDALAKKTKAVLEKQHQAIFKHPSVSNALDETTNSLSELIRTLSMLDNKGELAEMHKTRLITAKQVLAKYADLNEPKIVRSAPSVSEWRDVSKELPEQSGRYLIYDKDDGVALMHYYSQSKYLLSQVGITHWMSLPAKPTP